MAYTADAFDEREDLPSSGSGASVSTRETLYETEDTTADESRERSPAHGTFTDWFGNEDIAEVSFRGTLVEQDGVAKLFVRGELFVTSLDAASRAFYEETFIPTLASEGQAAWPGMETADGSIQEGVVAKLSPGGEVTFVYGRVAERESDQEPIRDAAEVQTETVPEPASEKMVVSLDEIV